MAAEVTEGWFEFKVAVEVIGVWVEFRVAAEVTEVESGNVLTF